jgi:serine/threonine-protein kinase
MPGTNERLGLALADRYRIERELGQGGMATVYLAEDLKHKRKVAIKVLKPELAAVLGAERFVQEITTTAALQHPHILPLFDSGTADGFLYYVMPYIQGETLRAKLDRETQLGIDEAVLIASDVASALHYAHQHGVIHRDIKPENILLHDGRPMVADFGIALAVSAAAGGRMTETGLSLGTPHYMSPEQATAEKEITARSDVYSLGSVLYEMLTGNPPHTGASAQQIIMKIVTEEAAPVTKLRKSVSPNVAAAVAKAVERLPADRFVSASDLARALADPGFRHGDPGAAPSHPRGRGAESRRIAAVALALATVGLVGAWLGTRFAAPPDDAPTGAMRFAISLPSAAGPRVLPVESNSIAIAPDGLTLVAVGAGPDGPQLFSRPASELAWRALPSTDGAQSPFFSHDGRWIAFTARGMLVKVPAAGGPPVNLTAIDEQGMANWGPGDQILVSIRGRLATLPGAGGVEPRFVPITDSASLQLGTWHPLPLDDGAHALFARNAGTEDTEIVFVSLETGVTRDLGLRGRPLGVVGDHLVYINEGHLAAVRFDAASGRVAGDQVRLLDLGSAVWNRPDRRQVAISRSGTLAYLTGQVRRELVLREVGGGARVLLPSASTISAPRFSPNGARIVLDRERDIWVLSLAPGAAPLRLTADTASTRPEWTPNGQGILYRSTAGGRSTFLARPVDGSGVARPLLELSGREVWQAVLSPDSTRIAFRTGTQSTADIWYRALWGDTTLYPIATTPSAEHSPRFSPEGGWVAYASEESGQMEVYVRAIPVAGAPIPVSLEGGQEPVWSRSGQALFYRQGSQLIRATLRTSPSINVVAREVFLDGYGSGATGTAFYDVSPSGREVVMTRLVADDVHLVFVHNWERELRARVGGRP